MGKVIGGILALMAVFGLAVLFKQISMIGSDAPQTQDAPAMTSQATPTMPHTPTETPTIVFTPTIDLQATTQANAVLAAEINLRAAALKATSEIEAAQIEQQSIVIQGENAAKVAEINGQYAVKLAELDMQNQYFALKRQDADNRAKELEIQDSKVIADYILAGGVLVIGVVALFALVNNYRARRELVTDEPEVTINEITPRDWLPVVQVNQSDGMGAIQHEPITPKQARRMLAAGIDAPLSFRSVSEFIKRAEWDEIRRALVPVFADYNRDGSLILNQTGQELIRKMTGEMETE